MIKKIILSSILVFQFAFVHAAQIADFVVLNGNFWTVDSSNPKAEAIASHQGRLIFASKAAALDTDSLQTWINLKCTTPKYKFRHNTKYRVKMMERVMMRYG